MKMLLWTTLILIAGVIGILSWASYPWSLGKTVKLSSITDVEPKDMIDIEEHPSVIKLLTFNLGFVYGEGSEGPGYETKDKEYFIKRLDQLSEELKGWGADIVFLQEIDFASSRSASINQDGVSCPEGPAILMLLKQFHGTPIIFLFPIGL